MNVSATELPNFIRIYYLLHELLIFKYWRQNISVSNIALHIPVLQSGTQASGSDVVLTHLLTHETPDFITPALWPANSPALTPSTTGFGGIRHCLPELWQCIQGYSFFVDTVYICMSCTMGLVVCRCPGCDSWDWRWSKRLSEWKDNTENRGMRVNMNKTKVLISEEQQKVTQKAVSLPCGVW